MARREDKLPRPVPAGAAEGARRQQELATGFGGKAKVDSHHECLQRCFRSLEIVGRRPGPPAGARRPGRRPTMDRTSWRSGEAGIDFPVLGIACHGIALPVFWSVLDKAGHPDTAGRIAPIERRRPLGRGPVWGRFVHLTALRLDGGDFLFIASSVAPRAEAIDARRRVEIPFGCLKSRGLNFEDTHLTDTKRLAKLMDLLALAFAWTCKTGQLRNEQNPILFKKHFGAPSNPSSATASTSSATSH